MRDEHAHLVDDVETGAIDHPDAAGAHEPGVARDRAGAGVEAEVRAGDLCDRVAEQVGRDAVRWHEREAVRRRGEPAAVRARVRALAIDELVVRAAQRIATLLEAEPARRDQPQCQEAKHPGDECRRYLLQLATVRSGTT